MSHPPTRPRLLAILAVLFAATCLTYAPVRDHEFVNFDSNVYLYENPVVREGVTWAGVRWAFTTTETANWHPVTWLSLMLDVQLFGLDPGAHHLSSVFLHAMNGVLLMLLVFWTTGSLWSAGLVAGWFALHPQHVECVAWAAQRKDVLSTFFLLLTFWGHVWYSKTPSRTRQSATLVVFALGLLAKPMLVTVPLLLLLFDHWPLARHRQQSWRSLIREKLPFLVLAIACSATTLFAQSREGAVGGLESYALTQRLANAATSAMIYLIQTLWPTSLCVFYPYPKQVPLEHWLPATVALLVLTALAWRSRRKLPFVATGWTWFLVSLVPVIGLIQVGRQSRADRYTYLPHIGLFLAIAWGCRALARRGPGWKNAMIGVGIASCLVLPGFTRQQLSTWRNSETLYQHALKVTKDNPAMEFNLGVAFVEKGDYENALGQIERVVALDPAYPRGHFTRGVILSRLGRQEEAAEAFRAAIAVEPNDMDSQSNLAAQYFRRSAYKLARTHFAEVARRQPQNLQARGNLIATLIRMQDWETALPLARETARQAPHDPRTQTHLAEVLLGLEQFAEARRILQEVIVRHPGHSEARELLDRVP